MRDGKLLSVVTRPFRTYRFWQCYYFYAEVDVKNRLNASLTFANAQTFTVEDEHFWQHYLFSCPVRVTVRIRLILLWPLQLFKPRPAIGISRCFLTDARWCAAFFFFFPSLPSYPSVTTTSLKLQPSFLLASRASISAAWFVLLWTLKSETNLENLESASQQWK